MIVRKLFIMGLSLFAITCSAGEPGAIDASAVEKLVPHYFGSNAHISDTQKKTYISGDFNNDGKQDIAILFKPGSNPKPSTQVKSSTPWQFPGSMKSGNGNYVTSLAIINGGNDGWTGKQSKVFALLDNSGVLETPSFELISVKPTDKEYKEHLAMLPSKSQGDIIILPTEAGIDTYIYWDNNEYKLYVPEEVP